MLRKEQGKGAIGLGQAGARWLLTVFSLTGAAYLAWVFISHQGGGH